MNIKENLIEQLNDLTAEDKLQVITTYAQEVDPDIIIYEDIDELLSTLTTKGAVELFYHEKLEPFAEKFWFNGVNYYCGNLNDLIANLWCDIDFANMILDDLSIVNKYDLNLDISELEDEEDEMYEDE